MDESLDSLFARAAAQPPDRDLHDLERRIERAIQTRRRERATLLAIAPINFAVVSLALAMGVTAGVALAISTELNRKTYGEFSAVGRLAPSTLLEGRE